MCVRVCVCVCVCVCMCAYVYTHTQTHPLESLTPSTTLRGHLMQFCDCLAQTHEADTVHHTPSVPPSQIESSSPAHGRSLRVHAPHDGCALFAALFAPANAP